MEAAKEITPSAQEKIVPLLIVGDSSDDGAIAVALRECETAGIIAEQQCDKGALRKRLLLENIETAIFVGLKAREHLSLCIQIDTAAIWDLRSESDDVLVAFLENEETSVEFRKSLALSTVVLTDSVKVVDAIEESFPISLTPGLSLEEALRISADPVLIGVGAGMGNLIETTPLIKSVSEALGRRIDVYTKSPVPGVETLLGRSPYVHMAFGDVSDCWHRHYNRVFVTGSAGHVIPPFNCSQKLVQRRSYEMMQECRIHHESEYNFLGATEIFPELEVPAETWKHFFVSDIQYTSPRNRVVGICDGKVPGKWQLREWGQFDELARVLQEAGYEVRSFGLKGQYVPGTVDKTGTTLRETVKNLAECSFFIASDGGVAHVTEAIGIPTIVLFGPTSIVKNGPIAPWTRALTSQAECSPCQWKVDFHTCKDNVCMSTITSEEIVETLTDLERHSQEDFVNSLPARRYYASDLLRELENASRLCRDVSLEEMLNLSFSHFPETAAFYTQVTRGNLRFGLLDRAEIVVQRGRQLFPDDIGLKRLAGDVLFRRGDFESGVLLSSELVAEKPDLRVGVILHCRFLLKLERWQEVVAFSYSRSNRPHEDAELAWLIGNAYRELGEWAEARRAFEFSLAQRPGVKRVEDALETLRDDLYRTVESRKPVENSDLPRVAIIADDLSLIGGLSRKLRHTNVYVFSKLTLSALYRQQSFFDSILATGSATFVEQMLEGLEDDALQKVAVLCNREPKGVLSLARWTDQRDSLISWIEGKYPPSFTAPTAGQFAGRRIVLFAHHHLARWSPHGGEKSMRAIVKDLQSEGAEVLVVVANMKTGDVLCEVHDDVRYVIASKWRFLEVLEEVLISYQPDLALTWGPQSLESGPLARRLGIPYVLFVRYWKVVQEPPYDAVTLDGPASDAEFEKFSPVYQHATEVITNGQYVTDVVDRKYGVSSKVAYVPVTPPPETYSPLPVSERPYVTLVNPRKAKGEYIIRQLAQRLPSIPFKVIGEPSISLPPNVTEVPYFKGHYTEMLKDTRVLLFPWGEVPCGTGRVVFEAHYAGVPVVSVDLGGMYEVLPPERLVSENEALEEWVEAVQKAYEITDDEVAELPKLSAEFPEDQGRLVLYESLSRILNSNE